MTSAIALRVFNLKRNDSFGIHTLLKDYQIALLLMYIYYFDTLLTLGFKSMKSVKF